MNKQERSKESALIILASSPSYTEAARLLEVDPSTVYEWLKDKEFATRLEQTRNLIFGEAVSKLKGHCTKAVDTLASLLSDESPQVRRGASNDILNHATKFKELQEFDQRLAALEQRSKNKR